MKSPGGRLAAMLVMMSMLVPMFAIAASATTEGAATRMGGADRYATAAAVSAHVFSGGVDRVYVATGEAYPDALAGGALAGVQRSPLLLVQGSTIPPVTAEELRRLDPGEVVVLGGSSAVSDHVVGELQELTGADVTRIAGADRYATAAAIADSFPTGISNVFVATGAGFPDAVAAATTATSHKAPIVLVSQGSVPDVARAALERLSPQQVVVLGGTAAISDAVVTQLSSVAGHVTRAAGPDRYTTSVTLSRTVFPDGATTVFLANASTFPDALAAGPVPSMTGAAPLLLTKATCLPEAVETELARLAPEEIIVLGGTGAVSDDAVNGAVCPPVFPPGSGYLNKGTSPGEPQDPRFTAQRWDPCTPVRVRLNPDGAPPGAEEIVREATVLLAAATGITFEYAGLSTIPWSASWRDRGEDVPPDWDLGPDTDIWIAWTAEPFGSIAPADFPHWGDQRSVVVERGLRMEDAWIAFNPAVTKPMEFRGGYSSGWGWGTWLLYRLALAAGVEFVGDNVPEIMHWPAYNRPDFPAYYGPLDRAALAANGAVRGCLPPD